MPDGGHAFLSPSSSVIWLRCPPAAHLCARYPDQGTVYMSEGTEAHALIEFRLKQDMGLPCADPRPSFRYYSAEMEECAEAWLQYIRERIAAHEKASASAAAPLVGVEQRLDLRKYIPESMGTADCIILSDDCIEVIDYKYGMHPVKASSPQVRIYALGALELFGPLYLIKKVRMAIFQPRVPNVDEAEMTVEELAAWGRDELVPRAREAFEGKGSFACGEWCRICKAKANCRALADYQLEIARYGSPDPALMTDAEIAEVLLRAEDLVSWANSVKEYALQEALRGHVFPGFKVVEGRAMRRFLLDDDVAARVEAEGMDPWEKHLKGITAMEKMLGKKKFAELLSDLVSKPVGKPTLVPEEDKRSPMKVSGAVFTPVNVA